MIRIPPRPRTPPTVITTRSIGAYEFQFVEDSSHEHFVQLVENGVVIWKSPPCEHGHADREKILRARLQVGLAFLVGHLSTLREKTLALIHELTRYAEH